MSEVCSDATPNSGEKINVVDVCIGNASRLKVDKAGQVTEGVHSVECRILYETH